MNCQDDDEDIPAEVDFSGGMRGRHAARCREGSILREREPLARNTVGATLRSRRSKRIHQCVHTVFEPRVPSLVDAFEPHLSPRDIRSSPDGSGFFVADMKADGVHVIDPVSYRRVGFIHTGKATHGLYPSRDGRLLYVTNRGWNTLESGRNCRRINGVVKDGKAIDLTKLPAAPVISTLKTIP